MPLSSVFSRVPPLQDQGRLPGQPGLEDNSDPPLSTRSILCFFSKWKRNQISIVTAWNERRFDGKKRVSKAKKGRGGDGELVPIVNRFLSDSGFLLCLDPVCASDKSLSTRSTSG